MKPVRLVSCLALSLFPILSGTACAQTGEAALPLPNADFEAGIQNWTLREKVAMTSVVPEAARSGKLGLRVQDTDDKAGSNALSERVAIVAGGGYQLNFWARSAANQPAAVDVRFFDAERKAVTDIKVSVPVKAAQDRWTQFSLTAKAPANAASLAVWIHSYSGAQATIDFDDFQLTALNAGEAVTLPAPVVEPKPAATSKTRMAPPYIMIKVDDLKHLSQGRIHPNWQRFVDFCKERKIKAGIGIVCNSLEDDAPRYVNWIKEQHATGFFEFWNHGLDHKEWQEGEVKMWEFKGPSYEQQKEHLTRSQQLFKDKIGFPMTTFGAPFNATDANTTKVLSEIPEINVWLYGDAKNPGGKLVLDRVYPVNIENPLFVPSLEKFQQGYAKYPGREYFVIQGHAAQWDAARWEQFVKIIDFLQGEKAVFVTPAEYAKIVQAKAAP